MCHSERGFPEFFKSHPTYSPSTFQREVIAIFPLTGVFFETPCMFQVKILGGQDIHVKEGSAVVLKCVITNIVEKPPFVTWYLNNKVSTEQPFV